MINEQQSIPHFDNPPIVEKLMGIEFAPLEQWGIEDLLAWFDFSREIAVRSFVDLTSQEMHKLWGRRDVA